MAQSGDIVTPRLDGEPWFEKPPLLYWMIAAGHTVGLRAEWAARLPGALLSVAFLVFFYRSVADEFSAELALTASAILATSAGWIAYSFAALTDLGMSAALAGAMLITLYEKRARSGWLAGGLLGFAILGKGLVPVVLFAPLFFVAPGMRLAIAAGALLVAAPWHVWCLSVNGAAFWNDYFWKQHVARFFTPALEHVQPFWYYLPVVLAALFPWTPLAALLARPGVYADSRLRLLGAWVLYGLVFFSASRNKLPGYILPLMPALAIVLAAALDAARVKRWWLAVCALLLIGLPVVASILPDALLSGIRSADVRPSLAGLLFLAALPAVWWLASKGRLQCAVLTVALAAGLGILYIKNTAFPALDRGVSVRAFWLTNRTILERACLGEIRRTWQYGLNYYAGRPIPSCQASELGRPMVHGTQDVLSIAVP